MNRLEAGIDTLFAAILESDDGGAALLDRLAREEPDVHRELVSLLGFHRRAGGFLETGPDLSAAIGAEGTIPPGTVLDHYRVEDLLGEGGMGVVYRAHDLALDRTAAVKVLRPEFAGLDADLLRREARILARLQHPRIATFHEARHTGAGWILAMECVAGTTLREALRAGPLSQETFLVLAEDMLTALGHAHAAGVWHLDLKPGNLMGTPDGHWTLLDFGISRAVESAEPGDRLVTGAGSPGYRAPEQATGRAEARSDVYGAAAVLWEACTGRRAFDPDRPGTPPAPLADHEDPSGVTGVLVRALAPDPADRPDSPPALLALLRDRVRGGATREVETLALLPFATGAATDPGRELREAVRERLVGVEGLRLVPEERLAVAAASAEIADDELGRRLGASLVARGVVGTSVDGMEVRVQVVETATGRLRFTEQVTGSLARPDEVGEELARRLARGMLGDSIALRGTRTEARVLSAYARGMEAFERGTRDGMEEARRHLEAALAADPDHVPSLVRLAAIHGLRYPVTTDPTDLDRATAYAERAVAVDPDAPDAHVWFAYAHLRRRETSPGLEAAWRAARLAPNAPIGPYFAGCHLHAQGRSEEATRAFAVAIARDPSMGWAYLGLGWGHLEAGRLLEARWALERAVELETADVVVPTVGAEALLAEALRRDGALDEAWVIVRRALASVEASDSYYRDTFRALALRTAGWIARDREDREGAAAAFRQAIAHVEGRPRMLAGGAVVVQALAGLAGLTGDANRLREAEELLASKDRYDFSWLWSCTDDVSRGEILRAGRSPGN